MSCSRDISLAIRETCLRTGQIFSSGRVVISMISTSEIKISVLVDEKDVDAGMKAVHDKFNLAAETMHKH